MLQKSRLSVSAFGSFRENFSTFASAAKSAKPNRDFSVSKSSSSALNANCCYCCLVLPLLRLPLLAAAPLLVVMHAFVLCGGGNCLWMLGIFID